MQVKWRPGDLFYHPQAPHRINRVHRVKGSKVWYLDNRYGAYPARGILRVADATQRIPWVRVERKYS